MTLESAYEAYNRLLLLKARGYCRCHVEAEDLVSATWERVLKNGWERATEGHEVGYLYTVLYHLYIDQVRHAQRFPAALSSDLQMEWIHTGAAVPSSFQTPDTGSERVEQCEQLAVVRVAIAALSPVLRESLMGALAHQPSTNRDRVNVYRARERLRRACA